MTAQISDSCVYKNKRYEIIGIEGGEIFSPSLFNMVPQMIHTACRRGHISIFEFRKDLLYLQQLSIREKEGYYPVISGVKADITEYLANYENLNMPLSFTGKLRFAKDFVKDLYIHMGFQKASAFKKVFDFTLNKGLITEVLDRSEEAAKIRGAFKKHYLTDANRFQSIADAFSLDMEFK